MSSLFIDSTYDLGLGVLDDGLNWLTFERLQGQKASVVIQSSAYELLKKHQINPQELKSIISINGPGFYTGLRLAEGFADVFQFFGVPHYSFYSYDIPAWCGVKSGVWFTKAYRGEYFFYHWDESGSRQELLSGKEIAAVLEKYENVFIHSDVSLDELSRGLIKQSTSTLEMLQKNPQVIFKNVLDQKLKKEAFYFRAPEDEFKANP
ncbi:hypothetical protein ACJVC5_06665 [Peredibacter sp. HCB2-198]|uniref:hypothetical protein n=1 Tax=Peredibacter sp. HCB2-198 TaxID=3383025 RepID=UPI0038B52F84